MLVSILSLAASLVLAQAPPVNGACAVLTPAHVTALIGAPAQTLPMGYGPIGGSCMFQNDDKVITVLVATNAAADAAQRVFDAHKRIAAGTDIAGWGVPAYGASVKTFATAAVLKQLSFVEVKVSNATQKPEALAQALQAAMKEFAARK